MSNWLMDDGTGTQSLQGVAPRCGGEFQLPSGVSSFAETMAAWRFYNNSRIEMSEWIEPSREQTRQQLLAAGVPVVMLMHNWSKLSDHGTCLETRSATDRTG